MFPAEDDKKNLHHIGDGRVQSLSCRSLLTVDLQAMISTKVIVLIMAPQDTPLVRLNRDLNPPLKPIQRGRTNTILTPTLPGLTTISYQQESHSNPTWRDYNRDQYRPAARLSAAPHSRSKPLTAYPSSNYGHSGKHTKPAKSSWNRTQNDQEHHSWSTSPGPKGQIKVSLKDDTRRDWIKKVRFGLNSKQRTKAACELTDAEKLQPCLAVDQDKFQAVYRAICALDRAIPADITNTATNLISGSRLLDELDVSEARVMDLRTTNMLASFPLPNIPRFALPEPFKGKQFTTWGLIHGTPAEGAQNILMEGFIRPANWSFNPDHSKCDMPTFGGYYLGLEIGREHTFPEWAARDLMDRSQKRGKKQQKVLIGALYLGADNHVG